ncbi:MAG TPA: hypothetical protein DCZ71_03605 [Ruminococcus sp.]|jgi:hypothetical protein|nr:hypothetical protein [Ruminococcus sp.]
MDTGSAAGMLKVMALLAGIMLVLWGMITYRHFRSGWTKKQKIMDITGIVILGAFLVLMIMPLQKMMV